MTAYRMTRARRRRIIDRIERDLALSRGVARWAEEARRELAQRLDAPSGWPMVESKATRRRASQFLEAALQSSFRGDVAKAFSLWRTCKAMLPADWFTNTQRQAGEGLHW